jgi:hypothetical protein
MWEVRQGRGANDAYEMLSPSGTQDSADSDRTTITSFRYALDSYQSTSYIIAYLLLTLTALFLGFTLAALGTSVASPNKATFGIVGIMPSVTLASGDCNNLKYANWALDLIINCIGTAIIVSSSYLQQSISLLIL